MRAALLRGKAQPLEITDLEIAPPAPGEVKIRLVASGICRSDASRKKKAPFRPRR